MFGSNQRRLTLQFHITGKCNLRCKHCYRAEGDVEPLTFAQIRMVVEQLLQLREAYNAHYGIRKRAHINLTGGEPFFREDIDQILRCLGQYKDRLTYGVLTNGSFLDAQTVQVLKETGVSFVQLSIDGDERIHDSLRAPGDYKRVFRVARMLVKNGIRTYISFTANRKNMHCLPKVAWECRRNHIHKLWSDRLVPIGNGKELAQLAITCEDMQDYLRYLKKARGGKLTQWLFPDTHVAQNRALQFWNDDGPVYGCTAGISLLAVDEFGRIMPCRRMPVICGDVFSSTLEKVYFTDPFFTQLRGESVPQACGQCEYSLLCRGGAKCQSYAQTGDFLGADPACPHVSAITNRNG